MERAYAILFTALLLSLGVCTFFALLRAIRGPRTADRIVGINMIGTLSLLCIAAAALYLKESWLLDVCLIYGMISFLAVLVLVMTRINRARRADAETEEERYD